MRKKKNQRDEKQGSAHHTKNGKKGDSQGQNHPPHQNEKAMNEM